MEITTTHSFYSPTNDLLYHIGVLRSVAACSYILGINYLFQDAKNSHDNIVKKYNAHVKDLEEQNKPKGFLNYMSSCLFGSDTHVYQKLEYLENDPLYQKTLDLLKTKEKTIIEGVLNDCLKKLRLLQ